MRKAEVEQAGKLIEAEKKTKELLEKVHALSGTSSGWNVHFNGFSGIPITHFLAECGLEEKDLVEALKKICVAKLTEKSRMIEHHLKQLGVTY